MHIKRNCLGGEVPEKDHEPSASNVSLVLGDDGDLIYKKINCVLMVFLLYHVKGQVIASGFRTTHMLWLAFMQGVW